MKTSLSEILETAVNEISGKKAVEPELHGVKGQLDLNGLAPEALGFPKDLDLRSLISNKEKSFEPLVILQKLSSKKYQLILAYIHYGDQLRTLFRDGIYAHFQEHLEEERAQLYQLNKKITALGADAPCCPDPVPATCLNDAKAVLSNLLAMETESVTLWSDLFRETTHDVALNGMAQNYATECQGHVDDMKRYLRSCE